MLYTLVLMLAVDDQMLGRNSITDPYTLCWVRADKAAARMCSTGNVSVARFGEFHYVVSPNHR